MDLIYRVPRHILPPAGLPLAAAVSGGADSLCLLGLLLDLGHRPVVAHVDHSLRPESAAEAAQVGELARSLGLEFALARVQPRALAAARKWSLEEASRHLRYGALARTAVQYGAAHIATGHTADDQAETVLMHFLRGSGLAGLKGMPYSTPLAELHLPTLSPGSGKLMLVRPLLDMSRVETEAYCAARGWTPIFDPSNADTSFFRNRLRHELLPELEKYNPNIRRVLTRTAAVLAADYEALQAETGRAWEEALDHTEAGAVYFRRAALLALPLAYRRGVLRRAIASLRPDLRDIDFGTVARALAFAEAPPATGKVDLAAGLCLRVQDDRLALCEWHYAPGVDDLPQLSEPVRLPLPLGIVSIGSGWRARTETREGKSEVSDFGRLRESPDSIHSELEHKHDIWQAFFDADAVGDEIMLRPRRPGDRLQPIGMEAGSTKVSDLMINLKVPSAAREGWPLLVNGRDVLWVTGLRTHHDYRITSDTRRVLVVALEHPE